MDISDKSVEETFKIKKHNKISDNSQV